MTDATPLALRGDANKENSQAAGTSARQPITPPNADQLAALRKFVGGGSQFSFVKTLAPVSYPIHS